MENALQRGVRGRWVRGAAARPAGILVLPGIQDCLGREGLTDFFLGAGCQLQGCCGSVMAPTPGFSEKPLQAKFGTRWTQSRSPGECAPGVSDSSGSGPGLVFLRVGWSGEGAVGQTHQSPQLSSAANAQSQQPAPRNLSIHVPWTDLNNVFVKTDVPWQSVCVHVCVCVTSVRGLLAGGSLSQWKPYFTGKGRVSGATCPGA